MLFNSSFFKLTNAKKFLYRHILLILLFAFAYYLASIFIKDSMHNNIASIKSDSKENKENNENNEINEINNVSFYDCIYFSLVTQTTVGYGDIVPAHPITKFINMIQLLTIYGILLVTF